MKSIIYTKIIDEAGRTCWQWEVFTVLGAGAWAVDQDTLLLGGGYARTAKDAQHDAEIFADAP